jgi:hypothetical protein
METIPKDGKHSGTFRGSFIALCLSFYCLFFYTYRTAYRNEHRRLRLQGVRRPELVET